MFGKISLKACAKINLCLDIIGVRDDGYHLIESIMQSVNLCDRVCVRKTGDQIKVICDKMDIPENENTAYKAVKCFYQECGISENNGVIVGIKKRIPSQAGLGGGSADAAATLVALNKLYKTRLSDEQICKIGEKVGADVPFCICGGTRLVRGIGEIITKLEDFYDCYFVIVKGNECVSTKKAYQDFDESDVNVKLRTEKVIEAISSGNFDDLKGKLVNAFQETGDMPYIHKTVEKLKSLGAVEAVMTGSGSAVFGIFKCGKTARKCADILKKEYPFVCITKPSVKGIL